MSDLEPRHNFPLQAIPSSRKSRSGKDNMSHTPDGPDQVSLGVPSPAPLLQPMEIDTEPGYFGNSEEPEGASNIALVEKPCPDGGYGWVCTACVFFFNVSTWGVNSSWAVIMASYSNNPDTMKASNFELTIIGGLSISGALLIAPLVPELSKRIGLTWTLLFGTVLESVALLTSSFATEVWQLFLSQGLCFGWGMSLLYMTASVILPPWFSSKRSLAVGLAASGVGVGGLLYSLATNSIIEAMGVPKAYQILAGCTFATNLVCSLLLKEWNTNKAQQKSAEWRFNPRDFARAELLLVILWGIATEFGYIILYYSLPTYASYIGLSSTQGAVANAMLSVGVSVGRPVVGLISDIFGRINVAGGVTLFCSIVCFAIWIPAHSYAPLLVFALFAGASCGTFWGTLTPVLADIVGIKQLVSTFGVICLSLVVPTTFAEAVAIEMVGNEGGKQVFTDAQIFVGFMFLLGSLSLWFLRCWKIADVEQQRSEEERVSSGKNPLTWITPRLLFSPMRV